MRRYFGGRRVGAARFLLMAVVWGALFAAVIWLVMLLWNWLMPALFVGAKSIDYWQALGLLVLCKVLFGGGHGRWKAHRRRDGVTVEEREQLRRHFRSRWGGRRSRSFGADSAE